MKKIILILLFILIPSLFLLLTYAQTNNKFSFLIHPTPSVAISASISPLPTFMPHSPEVITQQYYQAYLTCMQQYTKTKDTRPITQACPVHMWPGLSNTFTNASDTTYTDQILCDEGSPISLKIGQAYYNDSTDAQIIITTIFPDSTYSIPVTLKQTNGIWLITEIDCDLDGHID